MIDKLSQILKVADLGPLRITLCKECGRFFRHVWKNGEVLLMSHRSRQTL